MSVLEGLPEPVSACQMKRKMTRAALITAPTCYNEVARERNRDGFPTHSGGDTLPPEVRIHEHAEDVAFRWAACHETHGNQLAGFPMVDKRRNSRRPPCHRAGPMRGGTARQCPSSGLLTDGRFLTSPPIGPQTAPCHSPSRSSSGSFRSFRQDVWSTGILFRISNYSLEDQAGDPEEIRLECR